MVTSRPICDAPCGRDRVSVITAVVSAYNVVARTPNPTYGGSRINSWWLHTP